MQDPTVVPHEPGDDTFLSRVTPIVLTLNEEANIGRCLASLGWALRVVVVDSGSSDRTHEVACRFRNTEVHYRRFDDHAAQWNFGLSLVETEWALAMDADYIATPEFVRELSSLPEGSDCGCYAVAFDYWVLGKPLRASLYPQRRVLFRRADAQFVMDGHTQRLTTPYNTGHLSARLSHDDRKNMRCWLANQAAYSKAEAEKLVGSTYAELSLADRVRKTKVFGPLAVAFYCFVVKGLFLDGWRGIYYCGERVTAEIILSLHLIRAKLGLE